ncbi:regulator of G-protein signaling 3-like isoform X2 [Dreissena polymorpha]|uniref:regulator of G-protein signaling 3-like isoform X2 n=1 Tax=Dreissena polymorpha TaxID=45954 RepID=UPI00226531F4|nr:regulator of G-protein signaling 3-like isoform X2 [Dreissena polymorpha]
MGLNIIKKMPCLICIKGIHLDEPSSPESKHVPHDDLVAMRHGVTITKIPKQSIEENNTAGIVRVPRRYKTSSEIPECRKTSSGIPERRNSKDVPNEINLKNIVDQTQQLNLCKSHNIIDRNTCKNVTDSENSNRPSVTVKVTLDLDDDEGLDIVDSNSDIAKGETTHADRLHVESDESSSEEETSDSDTAIIEEIVNETNDVVDGNLQSTGNPKKSHHEKDSKKRKFRDLLPALRRSQSVGCESEFPPEHALFMQNFPRAKDRKDYVDKDETTRRMVHKTCSADAAMMSSEVLPLDPHEIVRSKQKSSIARNVRKKLQKLKRRNTDSLLGAVIMTVRGTNQVTQADAVEWGNSFESLLMDKNGIEMFRNFLKSEFSEENIEFWIACEDFKTIRTNRLVTRAQKIYSDFIAIKAPKQVNLDSKTRLDAVTGLENPTRDMFKQAQKRIQYLMENDSYKRFLESEGYRQLIGKHSPSLHSSR